MHTMQNPPPPNAASLAATATNATTATSGPPPSRRLVDAPIRAFHWLFALSFVGAYLTAEGERLRLLHVTLGYTLAGLLTFRVLYGLVGPRQARLTLLWRKRAGLLAWCQAAAARTPLNWRQGQNLVMALSVVALLVLALPLTVSGYGSYNDWGDALGGDWLAEVHGLLGDALLVVVLGHIGWVAVLSVLRRSNVARPMLTGRTPGPGPDLARKNHAALAALLLVGVLAFWTWEWRQSSTWLAPGEALRSVVQALVQGDDD